MSAEEFHWRYSLRPDIKKAELVDGVVYVASPVNLKRHGSPQFELQGRLWDYSHRTPGVVGADNATIRLPQALRVLGDSEPQPDVLLAWDAEHGGTAEFDDEGWLISAPDLVAEVSYSSRSYDLHD